MTLLEKVGNILEDLKSSIIELTNQKNILEERIKELSNEIEVYKVLIRLNHLPDDLRQKIEDYENKLIDILNKKL